MSAYYRQMESVQIFCIHYISLYCIRFYLHIGGIAVVHIRTHPLSAAALCHKSLHPVKVPFLTYVPYKNFIRK